MFLRACPIVKGPWLDIKQNVSLSLTLTPFPCVLSLGFCHTLMGGNRLFKFLDWMKSVNCSHMKVKEPSCFLCTTISHYASYGGCFVLIHAPSLIWRIDTILVCLQGRYKMPPLDSWCHRCVHFDRKFRNNGGENPQFVNLLLFTW